MWHWYFQTKQGFIEKGPIKKGRSDPIKKGKVYLII